MPTKKHDDIPTIPLFDLSELTPTAIEKPKRAKNVATAACGHCVAGGRGPQNLVGLIRQGEHLVWREHTYATWSGARLTCRASGVALCALPPNHRRTSDMSALPHCSHDIRQSA